MSEQDRDNALLSQAVEDVYAMIDSLTLFEKQLTELSDTGKINYSFNRVPCYRL